MLRNLPIGLIVLSLVSTPSFASGWGKGSSNSGSGSVTGASNGSGFGSGSDSDSDADSNSGSGSGSESGSGSGSHEDEFNYFRIDCRYHSADQDDRRSDWDSDHGSDGKGKKIADLLNDRFAGKGKFDGDFDRDHDGRFCYGSAVYRITDHKVRDIHLAIGCDNRTIFNEDARLHTEMTLDRFQPLRAATPAIEVFPHGQLASEGTYTSVLDISYGRMKGLCYVHPVKYDGIERKY